MSKLRLFAGGHPVMLWGRRLDNHFNNCTHMKYLQRVKMHLCLAPCDSQKSVMCSASDRDGNIVSLRVEVERQ